ncbi:hypothetical protein MLGJGCBP_02687 [Rhodococcus sp. T7]|nr:hypothetical protein MLGJGCBP_02687 [Rhodococcus sp. T7]
MGNDRSNGPQSAAHRNSYSGIVVPFARRRPFEVTVADRIRDCSHIRCAGAPAQVVNCTVRREQLSVYDGLRAFGSPPANICYWRVFFLPDRAGLPLNFLNSLCKVL